MSGLMLKDFKLMLNQKRMLVILLVITILFGVTGESLFFIASYGSMLGVFLAVGTISYDEYDNGYAFLFTLPITRKGYVVEKYVFGLLTGGVTWGIITLLGTVLAQLRGESMGEWVIGEAGILAALYLMMFFMIPIRLKYGIEKGRTATIVLVIGFMTVITIIGKLLENMNMEINMEWMETLSLSTWLVAAVVLAVIAGVISIRLSFGIVEKKQF